MVARLADEFLIEFLGLVGAYHFDWLWESKTWAVRCSWQMVGGNGSSSLRCVVAERVKLGSGHQNWRRRPDDSLAQNHP